jgi:hypothetical protein
VERRVLQPGVRLVVDGAAPPTVVACCFPGGGMSSTYFDLPAPYSMAEHLAGRGIGVLLLDHPGVGTNPAPPDPWTLTPAAVADADAALVRSALAELGPAVEVVVGVGHSMGAMLVVLQQARHELYDRLVLLGHGSAGLPEALTPEDLAADPADVVDLARARFGRPLPGGTTASSEYLVGPDLPVDAREALDSAAAPLLAACGLFAMLPGSHAAELASLSVPVLAGVGEHDIAREPVGSVVHVLPGAFHNANVAPNRAELWDAVAHFVLAGSSEDDVQQDRHHHREDERPPEEPHAGPPT